VIPASHGTTWNLQCIISVALPALVTPAGSQIAQQVIASSFFQEARSVGLYITCKRLREVDTMALLQAALQQGEGRTLR
jgi:hypothetical protein